MTGKPAEWAVELGGLEVAKNTADGALQAAKAVLASSEYLSDKAVMDGAADALTVAKATSSATLSAASAAVDAANTAKKAAIDAATKALAAVATGVEEVAYTTAEATLPEVEVAEWDLKNALAEATNALMSSPEKAAFDAANAAVTQWKQDVAQLAGAEAGLPDAQMIEKAIKPVTDWISSHAILADISSILATATLKGVVKADGTFTSMTATVIGTVASAPFNVSVELDLSPAKVALFTDDICRALIHVLNDHVFVNPIPGI